MSVVGNILADMDNPPACFLSGGFMHGKVHEYGYAGVWLFAPSERGVVHRWRVDWSQRPLVAHYEGAVS